MRTSPIFLKCAVRRVRGAASDCRIEAGPIAFSCSIAGWMTCSGLTEVRFDREPEEIRSGHCRFPVKLGPKENLTLQITVSCSHDEALEQVGTFATQFQAAGDAQNTDGSPPCEIYSSNQQFNDWMRRSVADLAMMIRGNPEPGYPYAGVPWFSTVFGRDGIITAMQCLWVQPEIARGVLKFLASTQATEVDRRVDAEPGKIRARDPARRDGSTGRGAVRPLLREH